MTFSRVFALEVDGRAVLAFEASGTRMAQEILNESWLFDDLDALKSDGAPLRTAQSKLSVRPATGSHDPKLKADFEKQATAYRKLTAERARKLGLPEPPGSISC
jgi:hypothetical protein